MATKRAFEHLSRAVVPVIYKLTLKPDIQKFVFHGSVRIAVKVHERVNRVVLNAAELQIKSAHFGKHAAKVSVNESEETALFEFDEHLPEGEGELVIDYDGILNDKMRGFYRSKYVVGGEERYVAVTQFEAADARRALPCWDEPAFKAQFDVTLVVPKEKTALSNMSVESDKECPEDSTHRVVTFKRSPIMSTYLLAFTVGEYEYIEDKDEDGVEIRVYTAPGKKEQGRYALGVAKKTLPFYHKYFGIAYPLPKCDLIAVSDFAAGAMENWGLITYRDTALLVDPENTSAAAKQYVALVVGHELAHQWFGNLVTMEWWTHLWLNEGFASWIEYLCVDECFPDYDIWTQFCTADFARALELDALRHSHPIEVPIGHPDEINEIFDAVSYSKGCSVIRMLHTFIGDAAFRKGMNAYLTKHQYTNAATGDLWAALEKASGEKVGEIMSTWTLQLGFPVVKVTELKERSDEKKRVFKIEQEKFALEHKANDEFASYRWHIPIRVVSASSPNEPIVKALVAEREQIIEVPNVKPDEWLMFNPDSAGFYRTEYSTEMLEHLIEAVRKQQLNARERLLIQSDLFALARAGRVETSTVLHVLEAYKNETNFTVWADLSGNLRKIAELVQHYDADMQKRFDSFTRELYSAALERLGKEPRAGEPHLDAMLRGVVLGRLAAAGHHDVVSHARNLFAAHVSGERAIPADLRGVVYGAVLENGDRATLDSVLRLYREADLAEEKCRILRALGTVRDEQLVQSVLDFSISSDVRFQDTMYVYVGSTGSKRNAELTWKFVAANWKVLQERYRGGMLLPRFVKLAADPLGTHDHEKEVATFFEKHGEPGIERTVQQSLETIRLNARQIAHHRAGIEKFLSKF